MRFLTESHPPSEVTAMILLTQACSRQTEALTGRLGPNLDAAGTNGEDPTQARCRTDGEKPCCILLGHGHMSGGTNDLPKFLPISSFYRCFETFGPPIRKILVYTGMLPCLAPSWPQIMQICISFRSRSDLVLDADHALEFFYPISLFRRASRFRSF